MIELQNTSIHSSFTIHKTGIEPLGDPTYEEWLSCGQLLCNAEKGLHFCIGDWLNFGEKKWGDKYKEAVEKTGFEYGTLANDKYVASRVKFSLRNENLSFTHHFVVAPYETEEQKLLLSMAETLGLSAKQLREQKDRLLHPPKTVQLEQFWQLGDHILYCGDSASKNFINFCRPVNASLVFADPPYNANVAEWDTSFEWEHDYLATIAPIVAVTPGIASIKSFMRLTSMPYKWEMSYWINNGMTRGAIGFGNHIPVFLFTEGSLYRNEQDFERVDVDQAELDDWDRETVSIVGNDHSSFKHKGRKPIKMLRHIVNLFTKPDEIVIDPFLGTGTTLMACEDEGRKCIGSEINPEFCEEIIRRWEKQTEQEAKLWQ